MTISYAMKQLQIVELLVAVPPFPTLTYSFIYYFSLFCLSITPSLFHSRFKTYLFHKSYPRSFTSSRTALTDFWPDGFF